MTDLASLLQRVKEAKGTGLLTPAAMAFARGYAEYLIRRARRERLYRRVRYGTVR